MSFLQALKNELSRGMLLGRAEIARRRIEPILADSTPPSAYDSDKIFNALMQERPPRRAYRYDAHSLKQRGQDRAERLLQLLPSPPASALEIGCGDGMTGVALAAHGIQVQLVDLDDWRDERSRSLPFSQADVCEDSPLQLEGAPFDMVYSYNTFEHLPDPAIAFDKAVRLSGSGGYIYLKFGPLYSSAWGLHAYRTMPIPYAQFIFSRAFIAEKLTQLGIEDLGTDRETLQYLNEWRLAAYRSLWAQEDYVVLHERTRPDPGELDIVERYPKAFTGRGLTFEDLITKNVEVLIRKR